MTNKTEKESDKPVPTNTAGRIREHLSAILTSEIFVRSERLSRFLRFVVGKALEGRGDEISEYSIGVEVYDRPTAFDPRIDSTVRVEAGRLRAKLREYYEAEGTDSQSGSNSQRDAIHPLSGKLHPGRKKLKRKTMPQVVRR
jgi:hypothetical protein